MFQGGATGQRACLVLSSTRVRQSLIARGVTTCVLNVRGDKEACCVIHHRDERHKVSSGFVLFQDDYNKEQMGKTAVRRRVKCSTYAPNLTGRGRVDK